MLTIKALVILVIMTAPVTITLVVLVTNLTMVIVVMKLVINVRRILCKVPVISVKF
jgi:hypothetical protein